VFRSPELQKSRKVIKKFSSNINQVISVLSVFLQEDGRTNFLLFSQISYNGVKMK
jgi:hypothetical protein